MNNIFSKNYREGKINYWAVILLVLLFVFVSNGYNIVGWGYMVPKRYTYLLIAIAFYYIVTNYTTIRQSNPFFSKYALFMFMWPLVTVLCRAINGGNLGEEFFSCYSWVSLIFLYFVFCKYKVREFDLIIALSISAIIGASIQIYEQLNPSEAICGIITQDSEFYMGEVAEIRNNLFRFIVGNPRLPILMACFYWCCITKKFNFVYAIPLFLFLVSVYLFLTRQILISLAASFAFSFILQSKSKNKNWALIAIIIGVFFVHKYWSILFADLADSYEQNTGSTDIRIEGITYYLRVLASDPISAIIGHGHNTAIQAAADRLHFFANDIGFIGEAFLYGVIWIIPYFVLLYKVAKVYHKTLPLYIVLFIITTAISSIMIFPYRNGSEMYIWACVLYIAELHLTGKTKLTLK